MEYGICLPIRRDTTLECNINLAVRAEELGFNSAWVSDHLVVPNEQVGRFTKYFYDPLVLLTAIACKTQSISLGTSLIVLPYRNPVVLAKILSTIDLLSEGRLIFGAAAGWLKEEFDTLGADFKNRGRITNEYLEVIRNLWTEDSPEFEGEFLKYSDIKFYPKPLQNPHPDIWIGGNSEYAMKRAAKYGTAWQPTWITPIELNEAIPRLNGFLKEYGKDPDKFIISVRNRIELSGYYGLPDCYFKGSVLEVKNRVNEFKKAGVSHILFDPECKDDNETFELIEQIADEIIDK